VIIPQAEFASHSQRGSICTNAVVKTQKLRHKRDRVVKNRDAKREWWEWGDISEGVRRIESDRIGSYRYSVVSHGISRRTKVAKSPGARALELQPLNAELNWGELAKKYLKDAQQIGNFNAATSFCQIHKNKRQINKRQCTQTIAMQRCLCVCICRIWICVWMYLCIWCRYLRTQIHLLATLQLWEKIRE